MPLRVLGTHEVDLGPGAPRRKAMIHGEGRQADPPGLRAEDQPSRIGAMYPYVRSRVFRSDLAPAARPIEIQSLARRVRRIGVVVLGPVPRAIRMGPDGRGVVVMMKARRRGLVSQERIEPPSWILLGRGWVPRVPLRRGRRRRSSKRRRRRTARKVCNQPPLSL